MNREMNEDELYDSIEDIHTSGRTYELSREEKYEYIRKQVELHSELKDTIEKLCDNAIVPDTKGKFYNVDISNVSSEVKDAILENDKRILGYLGFNNHINAWATFYEWSCYGKIAYKIIYKYKTKEEIEKSILKLKDKLDIVDVDISKNGSDNSKRIKLTESKKTIKKTIKLLESSQFSKRLLAGDGDNNYREEEVVAVDIIGMKKLNITYLEEKFYADNPERKIYKYKNEYYDENEIVLVDYNYVDGNNLPRTKLTTMFIDRKISYADNIIRSYNIMNRIEISIIAWTVLNSMYRQKMIVPITTKVSTKAKEAISKIRNKYLDNFEVDNNGNVRMNGETTFNYMKNIVLAERNGKSPEVDTVQWNGWDIKNMDIVNYFRENFVRDGKIPTSRYDRSGSVGNLSIYKADGVPYDEVSFYNYLDRILHQFAHVIRKPTLMLTKVQFPELGLDNNFDNNVKYKWESFSNFLEAKEAEKNTKILSNIDQMLNFTDTKREPLFDPKYLFVKRFQFMTEEEWKENEKMKNENKSENTEEI